MQKKILRAAAENPDATLREIGMAAGINERSAATLAGRILRNPSIQQRYRELMSNTPGLGDQELLNKIVEGTNATVISRFAFKGKVKDTKTDVDYGTRRGYIDLATKLNGAQVNKMEVSGKGGSMLLPDPLLKTLEGMSEESLLSLVQKLAAK